MFTRRPIPAAADWLPRPRGWGTALALHNEAGDEEVPDGSA